jgi:HPt (histidine-containing phosphotransfer) domain-containing protein
MAYDMTPEPIVSEFVDDVEMRPILKIFVDGLGEHCAELDRGLREGDSETVRRIGHQLKGSGTGYGYPALSEAGRALEDAVVEAGTVNETVHAAAAELIGVCRRIQAGGGCS